MISQYDVKRCAEKNSDAWYYVDENNNVVDKTSKEVVGTLADLTTVLRKKLHCNFEVIYSCHGTLQTVFRCKDCGTVIFTYDDERYDPNLCCPDCGQYNTSFQYWSADEIEKDDQKKKSIQFMEQMRKEQIEADKRYYKRGRKYDWQIWNGHIRLGNRAVFLNLECCNLFKTKLKGLKLIVHISDKDGTGYIFKSHFTIPLSLYAFKIQRLVHKNNKRKKNSDK
ncbi:hypothetical protein IJ556_03525 [bacterium]|nr:hypothetical protein [bacterium]